MKKAETEEAIAIMQAWVDGKTIQHKDITTNSAWTDVVGNPVWSWTNTQYRIKPNAIYRQYSSAEECFTDLRCDGWLKRKEGTTNYMRICHLDKYVDYQKLFREYTYVDGTPFGKKVY